MHIVGTAGHVDHGKSSLVQKLTGTNPDRWLEEQQRGMTLDLGFAHLQFDDGLEAGIVDVPGHERFLHNMLAGAAGMEVLLLVVDANEGVMPQTREHLQILRYLNVRETIVVVTKVDTVPADMREASMEAIAQELRGTIAESARSIGVSNVTGENIAELRAAIHDALAKLALRPADAPAYLPIDRAFALPGHGTIVTGTLMQGSIATGDTLKLSPSDTPVRVRSLQTFNRRRDRVEAGARVAVNIPSVAVSDVRRGNVLVASQFVAADRLNVQFRALPEALPLLRRRNAVRAYIGSAEILGTLVFEETPSSDAQAPAQLFLRNAIAAPPATPFVVRRLSPKDILGGGLIGAPESDQGLAHEADAPLTADVAAHLERSLRLVSTAAEVAVELNRREDAVDQALRSLAERGDAIAVARPPAYVHAERANTLLQAIEQTLLDAQHREPWSLGLTSLALARALSHDEAVVVRLLAAFAADGRIVQRAGYFSTVDHNPVLTSEQRAFFEGVTEGDPAQPFAPVPLAAVLGAVKQSRVAGVQKAFDMLVARGALVKVNDELYRGSQVAAIRNRVEAYLRANERMTMAQFRDLIGTSRKYAVPLLEWFDARGITVRSGDFRMLRSRRANETLEDAPAV